MRKRLKVLLALILGFVSGAIHYQPATAAAEGNSSEPQAAQAQYMRSR